jgi:hypothetical protein
MKKTIFILTPFLILCECCAIFQVNERQSEFERTIQPLVNYATKDKLKNVYGPPFRKTMTLETESWHYYYLKDGNKFMISDIKEGQNINQEYDYLTLNFDNTDTLRSWNVVIAREIK